MHVTGTRFGRHVRGGLRRSLSHKPPRNVVVTGIGIVCPLGCNVEQVWKKLVEGKSGISRVTREGYEKISSKVAGYVPREEIDDTYFIRSKSLVTSYCLAAADAALNDASWDPQTEADKCRTGVSVGTGMVELDFIHQSGQALGAKGPRGVSPYFVPKILLNMPAGEVSIRRNLKGPNHSVSTACATGAHAIGDAARMISYGDCDVMVAGGADACISPLGFAGFVQIRALSRKFNDDPPKASRPFDKERDGFVMSEGAAVLLLEEESHAYNRGANPYARLAGYGLSGDAANIVAPPLDGDGPRRAMLSALNNSGYSFDEIGYINAHATSTPQGDIAEANAISSVFQSRTSSIAVSSTKGAVGHLLGGAGAIEAAFTVLSCFHGVIPPTINLSEQDSAVRLDCVPNQARNWRGNGSRVAISNSFGFGGTNASLIFVNL